MMKHKLINVLIAICLFSVVALSGCTGNISSSSQEEIDLKQLYREQNILLVPSEADFYYPFNENRQNAVFEMLFYYHWQTGTELSLDDVKEYLSSEFEEDGSVRIYNNGNWPEIEAYVNWGREHKKELEEFHYDVIKKMVYWGEEYKEVRINKYENLSLHNLNEIMLTIKDENYQPNFI